MAFDFASYISEHVRKAGSAAELARRWRVSEMQISRWQIGQDIRLSQLEKILERVGGDLSHAFSKPKAEAVAETPARYGKARVPTMPVHGRVRAGVMTEPADRIPDYEVPAMPQLWENSRWHSLTAGETILLEIEGDSMEPEYRNGDLIACREPDSAINHAQLDGAPCVFREGKEFTFKLLRRASDGKTIIGQPINPHHAPIVFKQSPEFQIRYVVLGKLDPGPRKLIHK